MVTVILLVVAPVLHDKLPAQPLAVNTALSPEQIPVLFELMLGAAGILPVLITISFDFGLTPHIVSHTAEYVPAALTVMLAVVAPVLHFTVPLQPVALNNAVSVPQSVSFVVAIVGVLGVTPVLITIGLELTLLPQMLLHVAV